MKNAKSSQVKHSSVKNHSRVKQRIGIYSGTFDPVHAGHIAFALQAAKQAKLDKVYLTPERHPRGKHHVTHYAHRVAMVRRATRPYRQLDVLELEDKTFSVTRTLPRLKRRFPNATLVYLCGSDVVRHMKAWPNVGRLLSSAELCVGRRHDEDIQGLQEIVARLARPPLAYQIIESQAPGVSSSQVREALRQKRGVQGLLASVRAYASQEWLYL